MPMRARQVGGVWTPLEPSRADIGVARSPQSRLMDGKQPLLAVHPHADCHAATSVSRRNATTALTAISSSRIKNSNICLTSFHQ